MKAAEKTIRTEHGFLGHVFGISAAAQKPTCQIEGGIKASSREIDEFFRMAGESPNARQLDDWLQTYCAPAGAAANEAQSARDASGSEPPSAPADSVHSSNPDGKGQN